MNKRGFVFAETVVVLVIVALSLTLLLTSYSLVARKTKEKETYDKASDKYLLYTISNLGTDSNCNYSENSSCGNINLSITYSSNQKRNILRCENTKMGILMEKIGKEKSYCNNVFNDFDIEYIYVVDDIENRLKQSSAVNNYDNGAIEYMKTLKKYNGKENSKVPIRYMIGAFKRNDVYYYASIEI